MKINIAEHAGFCFGVKNALDLVAQSIKEVRKLYTYGNIIHNPHIVKELEEKGVYAVQDISELPESAENGAVVIRSHGVPPQVYAELEAKGYGIIDATCPRVKSIHTKADEASKKSETTIIIGEKEHPEVTGIKGWAGSNSYVVYSRDDVDALPEIMSALVVAQTTITGEKWAQMLRLLNNRINEIEAFMSICPATEERQEEARKLAEASDHVIVIGGKDSSNTQKLYETCAIKCKQTQYIERTEELSIEKIRQNDIISVVAGASTPDWLIREVYLRMNEIKEALENNADENIAEEQEPPAAEQANADFMEEDENIAEEQEPPAAEQANADFMEEVEKSFVRVRRGQILSGTVVQVTDDEAYINIGYKTDGILTKAEMTADGGVSPADVLKTGEEIDVEVLTFNDGQGNMLLTRKRIESKNKWNEFVETAEDKKEFSCKVNKAVKGGLLAKTEGFDTFIPASQVGLRFVKDLASYEGKEIKVEIIDIDNRQKRIIASHKNILQKEEDKKLEELIGKFKKHDVIKGRVKRLADFGAFVDIGGIDGLLHIRDISWNNIKHPSEVLHEGDEIEITVLNTDFERKRISLGYKQLLPKPWDMAAEKYLVGDNVEGKIVRIVPFGVFVELEPGIDGLIHISQIATRRLERPEDELRVGDMVKAKVMEVSPAKKKISLSRREVLLEEQKAKEKAEKQKKEEQDEEIAYELPPYKETSVSLADFFPKTDE